MNDEPDDFWQRVGSELEAEDAVAYADHEATERVLGRLLLGLPRKQRRSSKRFVFLLVAAALLVASVAAATVVVVQQRRQSARASEAAGQALAGKPQSAVIAPAPPSALLEPSTAPLASDPPVLPSPPPAPGPPPSAWASSLDNATASPTPNSAAELLSAAGRARRKGDPGHAITLLADLQARFPNSPEARASDIALGMLQLQSGEAGAARSHFERYLQRSPQGALAADALWGRAQALFAEGNATEARASLTALLERYPSSAYASGARAKLRAP